MDVRDVEVAHGEELQSQQALLPTEEEAATGEEAAPRDQNVSLEPQAAAQDAAEAAEVAGKAESANIEFDAGAYTAVLISAFGGVKVNLDDGKDIKLHPMFVFLMMLPLFLMQLNALMGLRLDTDLHASIYKDIKEEQLLLTLKLLMVAVLQLMNFQYLLSTMKLLVFAVNPLTWVEIDHTKREDWIPVRETEGNKWVLDAMLYVGKILVHPIFMSPFAILALIMRLGIGYLVCVDSVSIILLAETVKDSIFNSLAITFITEMTTAWWTMVESVFNLEQLTKYEFKLKPPGTVWKKQKPTNTEDTWPCCQCFAADDTEYISKEVQDRFFLKKTMTGLLQTRVGQWLRRGKGHKNLRRLENVTTYGMMFWVYFQQLCVIVFAIHTNVLPIARDICTMWRWNAGKALFLKKTAGFVVTFLQYGIWFNIEEELDKVVGGDTDVCEAGGKHYRMVTSDRIEITREYPRAMCGGTAMIVCILVLPQVFRGLHGLIMESIVGKSEQEYAASGADGEGPSAELLQRLSEVEKGIKDLKGHEERFKRLTKFLQLEGYVFQQ
eukprot:TRINITY_DN3756_c0_g1_i2.p1 TRINITY_DN3756_c0_g1~~TRINITY_DN3756_c0_g1_i2.p1  ORF type:complete len:566 (-),score=94.68 TRINITY_DN3756_c0_g1_i2:117-1775(-)